MKNSIVRILLFIYLILISSFQAQQLETEIQTQIFNFGSTNNQLTSYTFNISPKSNYSTNLSFGLLTSETQVYKMDEKWTDSFTLLEEGIKKNGEIKFKTKIKSGEYFVEILMDGGTTGNWLGSIKINDKEIINNIISFTQDPESDEPPKYWAAMRKVSIEGDITSISIKAFNQPTTVAAISFYPAKIGDLKRVGKEIVITNRFKSPNSKLIVDLINKGSVNEALRLINALPEHRFRFEKAQFLLSTAGRLECENPRLLVDNAFHLIKEELTEKNSDELLLTLKITELYRYADEFYKSGGWDWNKLQTESGIFNHINFAGMALEELTNISEHPLFLQSAYYLGKVAFWNWVEQHPDYLIKKADKYLKIVQEYYPKNKLLKMYLGEKILSANYPKYKKDIPEWAYYQKKALDGALDIIHYWVENRQADNGEFGGKYDDDVEMMRWWLVARTAVNDSITLLGMERLVNGIWHSDWVFNGFSRKLRDVEHSSEPIADTQPMMIGLDYGNPVYVERCMESLDKIDLWTGINSKGHRHFKSSWYSATAIDTTSPKNMDVEMNTRTIKAIRWLAWYNRHPKAMSFLKEWSDAWLEDCLRTDKGKPKGIVPASVRFKDDEICGSSNNWYESGMFWRYYNFSSGTKMLQQFLSSYLLFEDAKYLEPIELSLELITNYYGKDLNNYAAGSEGWTVNKLVNSNNYAETIELWRLITGNSKYDSLIKEIGSDYIKYRLTKNEKFLINGSKKIIENSFYNRELLTTEAYFTDRVEIRNIREGEDYGTAHLESMYTGNIMSNSFYPFQPISWRNFGNNFAAVVRSSSSKNLEVKIVNLVNHNLDGSIVLHRLEKGKYHFELKSLKSNKTIIKNTFEIHKRNYNLILNIPSNDEVLLTINQIKKYKDSNLHLADLAITKSELIIALQKNENYKITLPIHNIGIKEVNNINVELFQYTSSGKKILSIKTITELKAPLDLIPKIKNVDFIVSNVKGKYGISISTKSNTDEITKLNNELDFFLD